MSDKDEILVNFQAFTGIEDIATCYDILQQKNWDLTAAVNSVMPQDFATADDVPIATRHVDSGQTAVPHVDLTEEGYDSRPPVVDLTGESPTATSPPRLLPPPLASMPILCCDLGVYHNNRRVPIQLPATATIKQLKELLEEETGIPVSEQELTGWPDTVAISDESILGDVGLIERGVYHLRVERGMAVVERPDTLGVRGGESQRRWEESSDGPKVPVGPFSPPVLPSSPSPPSSSSSSQYSDAHESLGDVETIDDSLFTSEVPDGSSHGAMRVPLIPEDCTEPPEALIYFTQRFEDRYGAMHPLFFIGSLSDAVREATSGLPLSSTRRPLFIYLHHDASILSNIFCSQLLCSDTIVNYLSSNFITWAWDLTLQQHRVKLLEMVKDCFGIVAKSSVEEVRAEQLPAILLVYKMKGSLDIRNIIQGEANLDSLMSTLISTVDEHQYHLDQEGAEERERVDRGRMIQDQDRAYHESLIADQEKERQRQVEEEQKQELEKAEEMEEQEREARRQSMEDSIPPEPGASCVEKVSTVRIRFPDGATLQRRFLGSHRLQDVVNLIGSKGYLLTEHKLITRVPRRDLSEMDLQQTLLESGFCPQEMVFLEER